MVGTFSCHLLPATLPATNFCAIFPHDNKHYAIQAVNLKNTSQLLEVMPQIVYLTEKHPTLILEVRLYINLRPTVMKHISLGLELVNSR